MSQPVQIPFDRYLEAIFASPNWLDVCTNMLSIYLEDIDGCRDNPGGRLPDIAPAIVDQVAAVADHGRRRQREVKSTAERRGTEFQPKAISTTYPAVAMLT